MHALDPWEEAQLHAEERQVHALREESAARQALRARRRAVSQGLHLDRLEGEGLRPGRAGAQAEDRAQLRTAGTHGLRIAVKGRALHDTLRNRPEQAHTSEMNVIIRCQTAVKVLAVANLIWPQAFDLASCKAIAHTATLSLHPLHPIHDHLLDKPFQGLFMCNVKGQPVVACRSRALGPLLLQVWQTQKFAQPGRQAAPGSQQFPNLHGKYVWSRCHEGPLNRARDRSTCSWLLPVTP